MSLTKKNALQIFAGTPEQHLTEQLLWSGNTAYLGITRYFSQEEAYYWYIFSIETHNGVLNTTGVRYELAQYGAFQTRQQARQDMCSYVEQMGDLLAKIQKAWEDNAKIYDENGELRA